VSLLDHVNELYIVMAGHVELVPPSSYTSSGAVTSGGGASTTFGSGGGVGSGGGAAAGKSGPDFGCFTRFNTASAVC
jgi:hypothetical protein